MVFALKLHLRIHHHIPSISFKVQPIQTTSLSPLHFHSRRKSINGFNASYVQGFERINNNGGGGGVDDGRKERGGGDGGGGGASVGEVVRLFFRFDEFLLGSDRDIVGVVGLPGKLAVLCVQAMWQLHLAMMEICYAAMLLTCVGFVFISAVITFLFLQFV